MRLRARDRTIDTRPVPVPITAIERQTSFHISYTRVSTDRAQQLWVSLASSGEWRPFGTLRAVIVRRQGTSKTTLTERDQSPIFSRNPISSYGIQWQGKIKPCQGRKRFVQRFSTFPCQVTPIPSLFFLALVDHLSPSPSPSPYPFLCFFPLIFLYLLQAPFGHQFRELHRYWGQIQDGLFRCLLTRRPKCLGYRWQGLAVRL